MEETKSISSAVHSGVWYKFKIFTWNDMLKYVFGEMYIEINKYMGRKGLKEAHQKYKNFKKEHGRYPNLNKTGLVGVIDKYLRSGPYTYHIYLWNGILKSLFVANMREIYKYVGKEGLEKAKYELKEFEKKYGKRPTSESEGMTIISITIQLGKWQRFGINDWNDLLYNTFYHKNSL